MKRTKRTSRRAPAGTAKYDKLYLMERTSGLTWKSRWFLLYEVKIGVTSKKVEKRRLDIDEDIPGDVALQTWVYLPGRAYAVEQRLLRKYRDKRFDPGGGPSAGNTEWLRVGWITYLCIWLDFWLVRHRTALNLFWLLLAALFVAWLYYDNHLY